MATELTEKQAFAYGFLRRFAEAGLGPDEARRAADAVKAGHWFSDVVEAGGKALLVPLLAATAAGAGGGYALARAAESPVDPAEVRDRELIDAYNFHAQQATARRRLARRTPRRPYSGR